MTNVQMRWGRFETSWVHPSDRHVCYVGHGHGYSVYYERNPRDRSLLARTGVSTMLLTKASKPEAWPSPYYVRRLFWCRWPLPCVAVFVSVVAAPSAVVASHEAKSTNGSSDLTSVDILFQNPHPTWDDRSLGVHQLRHWHLGNALSLPRSQITLISSVYQI